METASSKHESMIQTLKDELEKLKCEKWVIFKLDEKQLNQIVGVISQSAPKG